MKIEKGVILLGPEKAGKTADMFKIRTFAAHE
jgi:hypothetical protein